MKRKKKYISLPRVMKWFPQYIAKWWPGFNYLFVVIYVACYLCFTEGEKHSVFPEFNALLRRVILLLCPCVTLGSLEHMADI